MYRHKARGNLGCPLRCSSNERALSGNASWRAVRTLIGRNIGPHKFKIPANSGSSSCDFGSCPGALNAAPYSDQLRSAYRTASYPYRLACVPRPSTSLHLYVQRRQKIRIQIMAPVNMPSALKIFKDLTNRYQGRVDHSSLPRQRLWA